MRKTNIIPLFILIIASSIFSLLVIEIALRIFYPQQEPIKWFESSKKYGFLQRKVFSQHYPYKRHGFTMHVQTNSFGHRYKEYNQSDFHNAQYKKMLLLGDSFMFGFGVNIENSIASYLENMLNKDVHLKSVIINAGVVGWGTLQEVTYAKDHFGLFNPDVIILLFCGNDPDDDKNFIAGIGDREKGWFYFPGKLFLRDHSHLYRLISSHYTILLHNIIFKIKTKNNKNLIINRQSGCAITTLQWERTLKIIKEFHNDYLKFNKKGVLLVLSTSPWDNDHREKLNTLSNGRSLFYIDLYDETITLPPEKRCLKYDSHWSELMHYAAAKKISEGILKYYNHPVDLNSPVGKMLF
jgi:lysophospholipase L1-like esterase